MVYFTMLILSRQEVIFEKKPLIPSIFFFLSNTIIKAIRFQSITVRKLKIPKKTHKC